MVLQVSFSTGGTLGDDDCMFMFKVLEELELDMCISGGRACRPNPAGGLEDKEETQGHLEVCGG